MTTNSIVPVFDVGGVLLDWDPRHLYRRLFDDEAAMEAFLATVCTPDWNRAQDAGRSFDDGVALLVARFPAQAALIEAFHHRWTEMVPRALDDTVTLLGDLKAAGRPLYAITNFSAEKFDQERRRWPFFAWFDGIVVSGEVKLMKPDPPIYHHLLELYGLAAADCVFIDDTPANVDGARAVGMRAVHFDGAERLREHLTAMKAL